MSISNDGMELPSAYTVLYFKNKDEVVQFVEDCLGALKEHHISTITIAPAKSEGFCVQIATTEWLADILIQYCSEEQRIT